MQETHIQEIIQPHTLPHIIQEAGKKTQLRFIEFFTANIRNPNTRKAYYKAVTEFLIWCQTLHIPLDQLKPILVATYIEMLTQNQSPSTVKQHLAAIRALFDYLVTGQVIPFNPAASVKGPKSFTDTGKTPVLYEEDARILLESIATDTIIGLRDRALIGVMTYAFARVGATTTMRIKDYFIQGRRAWIVLHEKGGRFHRIPAHHKVAELLDLYIEAGDLAQDRDGPLFRTTGGRGRGLSERAMSQSDVLRMVKRRAKRAQLPPELCCHTFRATGITNYLQNGGSLETAARIAGHASTRTTQLYNRSQDDLTLCEIERIRIWLITLHQNIFLQNSHRYHL